MKRALGLMVIVASLVAVASVVGAATAAPAKKQDTSLSGAGSSFVFPLISKWIPALGSAYGYNVSYSPIGSGGGIAAITAKTVDFGATDAPLTKDQFAACKGCVEVPWALSATAIMYNLPGINCVLRLGGKQLSDIYLGNLTKWNDPRIAGNNGKCNLPDTKITAVYRSDNSGTTYNFTEYLAAVSPTWKSKLGVGVNAQWPAGLGARGSSGVAGVITKTPGSIGYADVAYALKNKIRFASVLNASGRYATPGLRGIQAAAATLPAKVTSEDGALSIVNPPKGNPLAYPISTFTYVVVPSGSSKAAELKKMVYWAVTQGQKFGPALLFQPLPKQVQAFAYKQIKKI
ncbi:phosphate ABC transporter substrate-binding protein PstS [Gaiella sp.]|uniref:phosphate ABC transporter substrate-binding protein PstS n=1 Tax=Gaiella sp. TaxID=2663207 RepID=UPI0032658E9D